MVEVEAVDILSIIECFVEERQITFQSLFRQYNRSRVRTTGPPHLTCLGRARMHDCSCIGPLKMYTFSFCNHCALA